VRTLVDDVLAALGLLTRLRLPKQTSSITSLSRGVWAYPLVGAAIGALSALVWLAAQGAGLAPGLSTGLAIGAQILLTGALHEDGLADFADGVGGGRDKARKLEIMRDSRIGTYGVLALILIVGLRWGSIADLPPPTVIAGLVGAATLGRLTIVGLLAFLPPAREDGLGALVADPPRLSIAVAFVLAVLIVVLFLPPVIAAAGFLAILLAGGVVGVLAKKHIGGFTGDVLGAGEQLAQTAALLAFTMLL
jgi:adenosylcobinamide-GDP ribazoletransferase